ncbi:monovalent cation:H+ antiporter-2, CPA2 family [Nannocystis exedens]|uniref:Monovalent cation:H+ antiporter-2, CPA2 family n=1 Tax=Nannocystis exedens TaxID=54 RepID=A0A1I2II78_9BACT|nr:cation:proton antiporter [Nannocystis exedens]PCC72537.1 potassium transporter [Nannocystis exedens]SFF42039.1 monovalent cation:H+ antiporter-2, CPA2 family [Nannocystis exedens]
MAGDVVHYIQDLSVILATAAVTSMLSQRLNQPPVLGYVLAGVLIGPYVPGIEVARDSGLLTHDLSEFGVIMLMFSIGLEFNLRKIARIGPAAGLTALFEVALMMTLGFGCARLFGWDRIQSLFVAACISSSSTMIAAKAFEEHRQRADFVDLAFAILVFDDMLTILVFALLTAVASGSGVSAGDFAWSVGQLIAFLLALLALGLLVIPRFIRRAAAHERPETLLIASVAVCFIMTSLAAAAGYSIALGAFVAGMLVSESGEGHKLEPHVLPLRNIFGAVFFVSVGMQSDPLEIGAQWPLVLALTAVVLVGKIVGVSTGAFLTGNGLTNAVRAGLGCAQNGEFSFIIAAFAIAAGILDKSMFPVVVGVSLLTQISTPMLVRRSERVADALQRWSPGRLQTFVDFYESWIEQLRTAPRTVTVWSRVRRSVILLVLDAALLLVSAAGSSLIHWDVVKFFADRFHLPPSLVDVVWVTLSLVVVGLFFLGVLRHLRAVARTLARIVVPAHADDGPDLGAAPRRALTVALEVALSLAVSGPLVAIAQPFVPLSTILLVLGLIALVLLYDGWRSLANLQGHVHAGTELIVAMLAKQSHEGGDVDEDRSLPGARDLLPGFPDLAPLRLDPGDFAIGRTLADLQLRQRSGATVMAIHRHSTPDTSPAPYAPLAQGDVLALAGTPEAIARARQILERG